MQFNYYYGAEADQFNFICVPKAMMKDPAFATLSLASKMLYGLLLDRMNLSMKNRWFDSENRVYIIYQITEIMEDLGNITKKKAIEYLHELETFGLVEKKRRGLGLPSYLYVKSFIIEKDYRTDTGDAMHIVDNTPVIKLVVNPKDLEPKKESIKEKMEEYKAVVKNTEPSAKKTAPDHKKDTVRE